MESIFLFIIYFFYLLTFFIQLRHQHVIKFHFIRVLLQKKISSSIIDIQCNAGVLSAIISQKVNTKIWDGHSSEIRERSHLKNIH